MKKQQGSALGILMVLTLLFIAGELALLFIHLSLGGLDAIASSTLAHQLFTPFILIPFAQFLGAQLLIYIVFVYFLWYLTTALAEWLTLSAVTTRYLAIALWCISLTAILSANVYYVSHSFFSILIQHDFLKDALTRTQWLLIFLCATSLCLLATMIALMQMLRGLGGGLHWLRHSIALIFIATIVFITTSKHFLSHPAAVSTATAQQPNIIIIGFDALRPDYLDASLPHFKQFLQSATVFTEAYAALARTLPSWSSTLTAQYPLHHHAREDCIDIKSIALDETLPKRLQQAGYETVFAADDNRFSYINKEFGFDRIIGDRGDVNDYILNAFNDFPLSNLLVPTPIGKILFPYNYANHAAAFTHDPNNFLDLLNGFFRQRSTKPLFMVVHFNVTAFPFYRFNDQQAYNNGTVTLYKASIKAADSVLGTFLHTLQQDGFLDHAIVVLVSDHGITMALPGERVTKEALYQGDKSRIRLQRTRYAATNKNLDMNVVTQNATGTTINVQADNVPAIMNPHNYGIDTSFGYGGDLLSPKQNQTLFAFRVYGANTLKPHLVTDRVLLLDLAPTLLDWLHLPPLQHADGISLAAYLTDPAAHAANERLLFLESGYSLPEIQQDGILIDKVIARSINLFQIDSKTGLVSMLPDAEKLSIANKQRGVLQGDWLLVYYPASAKYKMVMSANRQIHYEPYIALPYAVLVNLKTLQWTVDLTGPFAATAPLSALTQALNQFYGDEMQYYKTML
jgi:arylsulfatase A-like enzyme